MSSVSLSSPLAADAGEFIAAVRASKTQLHPWVDAPDTADRFTAYLNRAGRADQASYLIRHAECGGQVGYANINNIVWGAPGRNHRRL